jgi:flagellar biogenesis protein FliO
MSGARIDTAMSELNIHAAAPDARTLEPSSLFGRLFLPVLTLLRSIKFQRRERFMRLCETLPLGEKRFLAIVQIEHQRFLIATTNQSISLLYCLEGSSQPDSHPPAGSSDSCQDGIW